VPDRKPPRFAGDDRSTLLALLQYQRDSFVRKVTGVDTKEGERSAVPSGTSLLWLTNHMADAETTWVLRRFARRSDNESSEAPATDLDGAVARYQQTWRQVDAVVASEMSLDAVCPPFDDHPNVNLRWILAHLLEETARHAGHADILREFLDGQTGR
jgi:hypothetical protein